MVKTTNLKSLFRSLTKLVLIQSIGVRQELQSFTVDYILNMLVMKGPATDYLKSVALFQLLFEDKADEKGMLTTSKGYQSITSGDLTLFDYMAKKD